MRLLFFNANKLFFLLFIITSCNVAFFFYIKNSTHYLKIKVNQLKNELLTEEHNFAIQQAEFVKKYNVNNLQELARDKLKLQFSNVEQVIDLEKILKK